MKSVMIVGRINMTNDWVFSSNMRLNEPLAFSEGSVLLLFNGDLEAGQCRWNNIILNSEIAHRKRQEKKSQFIK